MSDKITALHKEKTAYVYVRQSTTYQLQHNHESRRRQYALESRAKELGFMKVVVIDDDLGISASGSAERPGFGRLLAAVCDGSVGAVLSIEASRLARNNRDWHHLIDLCALTATLVIDHDGVYDPRILNDRLLLGLKGTMSEFELGLLQQRSREALQQMISRGEVLFEPPMGYIRTRNNRCEQTPDLQVQEAIHGVFRKFVELGSARQVLLWYRREGIVLPSAVRGSSGTAVTWRLPIYRTIHNVLTNPTYAGAFTYGRRQSKTRVVDGRARKTAGHLVPRDKWTVLIRDHHPGYISWDEFEENQKRLAGNVAMRGAVTAGAAKRGPALLAGLLRCGRCGRKLHVAYTSGRRPRYHCRGAMINHGADWCISFGGHKVEQAVAEVFLEAVRPAGVQASLSAWEQASAAMDEKRRALELARQKAEYEVMHARRQYDAVDPANRLVAAELERRWNSALTDLADIECKLAAQEASRKPVDGHMRETLMALGHNVDAAWNDPAAPVELKKRLLRSVIKEIVCNVLETPRDIVLNVHWAGGVHSIVRVARPLPGEHRHRTDHKAVELIRELARVCPDKFIASILNRIGLKTGTGRTWTESYVHSHRRDRGIAPFDPNTPRDWLTMHEAATMLGVSDRVVRRLILEKKLPAAQIVTKAPWMIARRDLEAENVQVVARAIREGKRAPCADPGQQRLPFFTENSEL
jgi:excisionase family DNA binding protein